MPTKQIPALPPLNEAPADNDLLPLRDTSSGSDVYLRIDRLLERSQAQADAAEANANEYTESVLTTIGGYVTVQTDLTGAEEPDPERYIKLEADLMGEGEYNEGKLDNESVTGGAPLVEATAEIIDSESPMFGQVVDLVETSRRFFRAGLAGTVEFDQMQRITGQIGGDGASTGLPSSTQSSVPASGAFGKLADGAQNMAAGSSRPAQNFTFNSANSPDARASDTADGETRAKNIGVSVYMRIK